MREIITHDKVCGGPKPCIKAAKALLDHALDSEHIVSVVVHEATNASHFDGLNPRKAQVIVGNNNCISAVVIDKRGHKVQRLLFKTLDPHKAKTLLLTANLG